jgi:hypothetical protein
VLKAAACIAENYPVPKNLRAAVFRVLSNRPVTLKFLKQHFGSLAADPCSSKFSDDKNMTKNCSLSSATSIN